MFTNVALALVSGGAIKRFSGNLIGDPPIDEGGPQLCDVAGPGMNGGGPGSQN